jgi:histidyl-tRNA synthetase
MPPISAPRGTRDLLPADAAAWQWLHDVHDRVAGAHGYRLVDTPIYEHTELFERGVGAGTDVVDKEMFTFTDRGGRSLTLRPEGTAGVVRACLSAGLLQRERPLRVRYAGPMFRYDKPQRGRYHQFHQVGIECIGEQSPHLDAEVVETAWRFVEALGLRGVSLQLNTLGDIDDRRRYRAALIAYYTPLKDQLCDDCRRRLDTNPLRLLDCKRDAGLAAQAPRMGDSLAAESADFFAVVCADLDAAGITYQLNQRLVRGLDYYAHTAFELWHESLQGAQNALGGGGRYDGLAEVLGFAPTPGVGYGLGVDRLLMIASELGVAPAEAAGAGVAVIAVTQAQVMLAAGVARTLRAAGIATVLDVAERGLGGKLRSADRLGVRLAVLIGEDEARENAAQVRDLRSSVQQRVALDALAGVVADSLATSEASR